MGKDSVISNSDLRESTVSMASRFEPGATFQNVNLGANVKDLNLSGLTLNNLSIDGKAITSREQLTGLGVTVDNHTKVSASPEFIEECKIKCATAAARDAGMQLRGAMDVLTKPISPSPAAAPAQTVSIVPVIEQPVATRLEVTDSNLIEALAGSFNPAKDIVARTQPVPEVMIPGRPTNA
jgi:hypothetical protein